MRQPSASESHRDAGPAARPRRSALYMPAANPRAMDKARTLPCDVVILDLEDAVAPDAKAEALVEHYKTGTDMGAILEMLRSWGVPADKLDVVAQQQGAFMTHTAVGSPATCAEQVQEFVEFAQLDGLMLIFPDYVEGLKMFGAEILPGLRSAFA